MLDAMKSILCFILLTSVAYAQTTREEAQRGGDPTHVAQLPPEKDTHPRLTSGTSGYGVDDPYARLWNEKWVLSFRGKITGINVGPPAKNETGNTVQIIVLSPNGGSSFTLLGPQWYVESQRTKLHLGDKVVVTGCKTMIDHRGSIMASKIVVNGKSVLRLRDVHGAALWSSMSHAAVKVKPHAPNPVYTNQQGVTRVVHAHVGQFGAVLPIKVKSVTLDGVVHHFVNNNGEVTMFMRVDGQLRKILLGPEWVIVQQEIPIKPGDRITAKILAPDNLAALAYAETITTPHGTLRFRNDAGEATWLR